jgi:hypothetical protein
VVKIAVPLFLSQMFIKCIHKSSASLHRGDVSLILENTVGRTADLDAELTEVSPRYITVIEMLRTFNIPRFSAGDTYSR